MKKKRKVLSLLLSLCMVASMCPPTLAEELSNEMPLEQLENIDDITDEEDTQTGQIDQQEPITEEEQEVISNEETINEEIKDEEKNITPNEEVNKEEDSNDEQEIISNEDINNKTDTNVEQEVIPNEDDEDVKLEENENQEMIPNEEEENTESNKDNSEVTSNEKNDNEANTKENISDTKDNMEEISEEEDNSKTKEESNTDNIENETNSKIETSNESDVKKQETPKQEASTNEQKINMRTSEELSGTCGDNLTWSLKDRVLTISGTGDMYNYNQNHESNAAPWHEECWGIQTVYIEEGVTSIGDSAFYEFEYLQSITIPNSVTSIGDSAFYQCRSLSSISIPESVTNIGAFAFYDCWVLSSINIPDGMSNIGQNTFENCSSFTSIKIPSNLTMLNSNVFKGCGLKSVTIPDNITSIGEGAFQNCGITFITISDKLTNIKQGAFLGCDKLTHVYYLGTEQQWKSITIDSENEPLTSATINYNFDESNPEIVDSGTCGDDIRWTFSTDGILTIEGTGDMRNCYTPWENNCENIKTIHIQDGITSIGEDAFQYCRNATSVRIPNSITSIKPDAFNGCNSLISITIPNNVTDIGYNAFASCNSLTEIVIPDSVTNINDGAFYSCENLKSVKLSNNMTSIDSIFRYCTSLTDITIPNSVTSIKGFVFDGCSGLTTITIPNSVTEMGSAVFQGCDSLQSVKLSDNITVISDFMFNGCDNLTDIEIPEGVTSIKGNAFGSCSSLTHINIPENVTSIGESAFDSCNKLTDVYYTASEGKWKSIAIDSKNEPLLSANIHFESEGFEPEVVDSGTCGDNLTWIYNTDGTLTIEGTGDMDDYDNTDINNQNKKTPWQSRRGNIKTIIIKEGVTSIGEDTFYNCDNLISIEMPDTITSIGKSAFSNCKKLTSVNIPSSVTSIADYAFYYCENLTSANIAEGVNSIGNSAFNNCKSLTSIEIPDSVTAVGWAAFSYCSNAASLKLSSNLSVINQSTFSDCKNLLSVIIPEGVTSIGQDAFQYCESLENVTIPSTVTTIGGGAFVGCNFTTVTIPEGVTTIAGGAFTGCSNLESIIIAESVTKIGISFAVCDKLTDVYYVGSEEQWSSIDIASDYDYIPFESATIHYNFGKGDAATIDSGKCGDNLFWELDKNGVLTIKGTGEMYNYDYETLGNNIPTPWHERRKDIKKVIIQNGVTYIGEDIFRGCSNLTSVTIPNSVTTIGRGAFVQCESLNYITIPNSVTEMGNSVFWGCEKLTSVTMPENITAISSNLFEYCGSLTSITLPEGITSIGEEAFYGCNNLASLIIPEGVTEIGQQAFGGCGFTSITIPFGITHINRYTFENCGDLISITIPESVESIGERAFNGCDKLTDVYYEANEERWNNITIASENEPLTLATIHYNFDVSGGVTGEEFVSGKCGDNATWILNKDGVLTIKGTGEPYEYSDFDGGPWNREYRDDIKTVHIRDGITCISRGLLSDLRSVTSIIIPNSITSIGRRAFNDCQSLKSITIPKGVTSIGYCAFESCLNLQSVTMSDNVTFIDIGAFSGCRSLSSIKLSNGLTSISANTFSGCDLRSITIPDSVTTIGIYAFSGCSNLADITIPDSVTMIDKGAFVGCHSLKSITIPKGITAISDETFNSCQNLTDVTILDNITSIGKDAFSDCPNLSYIIIPSSITSIGDNAFSDCTNLADIYFGGSEEQWKALINAKNAPPEHTRIHFNSTGPKEDNDILAIEDMWSFANSTDYFGGEEEGYYITLADYYKLLSNLRWTERMTLLYADPSEIKDGIIWDTLGTLQGLLQKKYKLLYNINDGVENHIDWTGSCRGMSGIAALVKSSIITVSDLGSSAQILSEVALDSSIESAINFYQMQQLIPAVSDMQTEFMKKSQENQIKIMEEAVQSAKDNNAAALISFTFDGKSHTILGYAIEDGDFQFTIKGKDYQFNHKIVTYDPNYSGDKQDYYNNSIYYNDTIWAIPGYDAISKDNNLDITSNDNTAQLQIATANMNFINAVDYLTGEKNFNASQSNTYLYTNNKKRFTINIAGKIDNIIKGLFDGKSSISPNGGIILVNATDNNSNETPFYSIAYSDLNGDYEIYSEEEPISFSLAYDDYYLNANSEQPGTVHFSSDGKIELTAEENGSGSLSITTNNNSSLPWHTISIENPNTNKVSLELDDEGILLQGNNMTDVVVYGTDEDTTKELTFSTKENEVLISEKEDEMIILEDSNGDGTFDNIVQSTGNSKPDKPDVPNKPSEPEKPDNSNKPSVPTTPDNPTTPENPDIPKQQFTITFSGNGGMIDDETLKTILTSKNGKITNFPTPIRTGYTFDGWFTERYNGEEITAETVFTQDTTVYAQWTKNSSNNSNNSSSSSGGGGSSSHRRGSSSSSKSTASNQKAKVSCTAGGTVIANNDGTATITPDDGYKVFAISINGEKADIPQDGKLTNLKSEDTVMVRFEPISGIITTSVPSNNSNKFIDVPAGAWYYEAVNYVVAHNLFSGMSETKFAPNDTMTRAMLMTVLARMDGQDVTGGTTWYEKGMNWAKQKQISDGTNPESDITREQLAAMLYRYAGNPTTTGNLSQFSDNEQTSNYAKSALCWATEKGIISGKGNNILDPKGEATRAEVAAMLMRFCEIQ